MATPWTFLHLSLSSVILNGSSTESPDHDLMLSIQDVRGLTRLRAPGIVPCIISFFRQFPLLSDSSMATSLCGMCTDEDLYDATGRRLVSHHIDVDKDLLNNGYCVYMDNFYLSPSLFQELRQQQMDAVGTARINHKNMPPDPKKLIAKGTTVVRYTHDMMALKWRDKRDVVVLSTYHDDEMKTIQSARGQKEKPAAIFSYNE